MIESNETFEDDKNYEDSTHVRDGETATATKGEAINAPTKLRPIRTAA